MALNDKKDYGSLKMKYIKYYIQLIRNAQKRQSLDGYTEKHHVFPKSIFGKNDFVVVLTAREHYVAHALLERIYIKRYGKLSPKTKKMIRAFFMMSVAYGKGQKRYINSRLFEELKIRFSESITGEQNPLYGKKRIFSREHLENLRKSKKSGKDHPLYGIPRSEEIKIKMRKPKCPSHSKSLSRVRKGMKFTEEHKKNLSESHKGKESANKGKTLSNEQKKKMSLAQKNKDYSYINDDYKKKLSDSIKLHWEERRKKKLENNS